MCLVFRVLFDGCVVCCGCAVGREFAPAGDLLSFAPPKESRQRKGGPAGRVPCGATCDARARRGAAELALFASLSTLKQRQRVRARGACFAAPAPRPALLGTARRGFEFLTRAIAALGPGLISAAASRGSICSLSLWERHGLSGACRRRVRASQYKNRSCSRLPHKRCKCICLDSIVRRRRVGACTHAFSRVLAKPLTTARPAPHWPAQRVRPA